jgi:sulfate permease, SulP family
MPHRAHLFSLRVGHAIRECFTEGYHKKSLIKDILAGITVGIIAIPLAMAVAITSGVAPQYGLYSAIIAGSLIALTGGSRYSVSGPTAAFVVILYPIVQQYGLAGLLLATVMSGALLVVMGYARLGRFIEFIPESVTLGFTGGIAIVIATLQLKDFFGLALTEMPEYYVEKVMLLVHALPGLDGASLVVAALTLAVMLIWPKFKTPIPPHLPALILGSLFALLLNHNGMVVETIGSRFSYLLPDGTSGTGIPPFLPHFEWPWLRPGPKGVSLTLSWQLISVLLPAAFAIAMLGAIESLLCAVVLDGMTGKRHSANSELLGQGMGNMITPFFGGITSTAAIARSAVNFKAGATSPVSAVVHALVVLAGLLLLAPILAYLPMPAMAALLLMVAWSMSEAPKSIHLLKTAPRGDILVFLACLSLTVLFDMVIAITTGILLAAVLFMREIAETTKVTDITLSKRIIKAKLPDGWLVFKINGPLFFAAADRVFSEIALYSTQAKGLILYLDGVPLLDAGGVAAITKLVGNYQKNKTKVIFCDLQFQPLKTLARANIKPIKHLTQFYSTLQEALQEVARNKDARNVPS